MSFVKVANSVLAAGKKVLELIMLYFLVPAGVVNLFSIYLDIIFHDPCAEIQPDTRSCCRCRCVENSSQTLPQEPTVSTGALKQLL